MAATAASRCAQRLLDGKRVHIPAQAFASLQRGFQIMPGNLDGERIRDRLARAVLVLHPRRMRQRDPHSSSVDQKLDVDSVSMPRSNSNDQRLIDTVNRLLSPAVRSSEILKHG